MQYTTNYNMAKFDGTDTVNPNSRNALNTNMDIIDTQMKALETIPNASASVVGGVKVYYDSTNSALYITNDGTNPTP